eukprot:gene39690-48325_t
MNSLRVEVAETGEVLTVRCEHSFDQLKNELAMLTPTPSLEQILLFGPPFQPLDKAYRPSLDLTDKRVFLYDKRVLQGQSAPTAVPLPPFEFPPAQSDATFASMSSLSSEFSATLPPQLRHFDQQFRLRVQRAQQLEKHAQDSVAAAINFLAQLQVQADATHAAVLSVRESFAKLSAAFEDNWGALSAVHAQDSQLLESVPGT